MQLGFLLELPGVAGSGKVMDGLFGLHTLVQGLSAYIVVFVLVNFLMYYRQGGGSGIHGAFLLLGHSGCFIRGDVRPSKTQMLGFFCGLVGIQF